MTLVGHKQAVEQIVALLQAGRFPHALIIHGPRGVGKRKLAEALAYRLVCGGEGIKADESAPAYAQIMAGSCPDFHVVEPEKGKKSIGIAQAREVLAVLGRSADTQRVVLVDALDDLTEEAANTLLKTLEEPRPGITFLLVCHQLSAVLPTIRSRARLLRLHPLALEDVRKVLRAAGEDESLAPLAQGCPGMVLGEGAEALRKLSGQLAAHVREGAALPGFTPATAPMVIEALKVLLAAEKPSLATAKAYAALAKLQAQAADMNLPHALVAEAAVGIVREAHVG
jgi:DNA polymerase-3 subunit delta'